MKSTKINIKKLIKTSKTIKIPFTDFYSILLISFLTLMKYSEEIGEISSRNSMQLSINFFPELVNSLNNISNDDKKYLIETFNNKQNEIPEILQTYMFLYLMFNYKDKDKDKKKCFKF